MGRTIRAAPVRMCIGCRGRSDKQVLLRLVGTDGGVVVDPQQVRPGRGAYLHPSPDCLAQAVRRRALGRALRVEGTGPAGLEHATAGLLEPGPDAQ